MSHHCARRTIAISQQLINVPLEAASADPIAQDSDFAVLLLRLLIGFPVETANDTEKSNEKENASHDTADCAGAEGARGDDDRV